MTIEIKTDQTLDPKNSIIIVNGITYKNFNSLQLRISRDQKGELVIDHESGYLEAYKAEVNNEI